MLAIKHFQYEISGDDKDKVVDIEHTINPKIYINASDKKRISNYSHVVDIMLGEAYGKDKSGTAIELKSYLGRSLSAGTTRWKRSSSARLNPETGEKIPSSGNSHKQFYLDRIALHEKYIGDFVWWFQKFRVGKTDSGPTQGQIDRIAKERLTSLPSPKKGAKKNLGGTNKNRIKMKKKIKLFSIKTFFIYEGSRFLKGIAKETTNELVNNLH